MPPADTETYSPGAERAAEEIDTAYGCSQAFNDSPPSRTNVADIISRETHDAEMLEALRTILSSTDHITEPLSNLLQIRATAGALIAKVDGR